MWWNVSLALLEGFGMTCLIFLLTLLFALPLGLLITFGSASKIKAVALPVKVLVWMVRGTPLMLQILIFFYAPGLLFGWHGMERFTTIIVAFSVNYACYFSEIYRSGIQSIPHGQYEAGQVLGMTKGQIFFKVIFMQVVRRILPPMGNEVITLVKDTALARIITVQEVLQIAFSRYVSQGIVWPLFYTGAFYLAFVGILTVFFHYFEKKLNYYRI